MAPDHEDQVGGDQGELDPCVLGNRYRAVRPEPAVACGGGRQLSVPRVHDLQGRREQSLQLAPAQKPLRVGLPRVPIAPVSRQTSAECAEVPQAETDCVRDAPEDELQVVLRGVLPQAAAAHRAADA